MCEVHTVQFTRRKTERNTRLSHETCQLKQVRTIESSNSIKTDLNKPSNSENYPPPSTFAQMLANKQLQPPHSFPVLHQLKPPTYCIQLLAGTEFVV